MKTKAFSRFDAGLICYRRLQQAREGLVLPLDEFADHLIKESFIPKPIARQTLWRILAGRYYNPLSFEGENIDFSLMPANVKGSSPEDKQSHELADLRASYHEIRHELTDHVRRLWARIEELEALGPAGRHELLSQLTRSAPPTSPAQKDFS
jgi:hypothetical protein